jgi:acetylornithine deacetylase
MQLHPTPADPFSLDEVAAVLSDLVRIDSRNPHLAAAAPGEAAIARHCVDWLNRHGVEAWVDEVARGRCNAVARVRGGDGPALTFCAHLDTVDTRDMHDAFEPRIENGRLYGRGAYDMKGGVAAILVTLAALARRPPPGTVMAALVADEEYASIGAMDFVARYASDACIVTEPSEGRLITAHKGFVWAEIATHGTAAHGSLWEEGVSAIGRMGRIIAALEAFDRDVLRSRAHPLVGPASLHCATVVGGHGLSTYAPTCTLGVERRTLPGETPAQVLDELRGVIAAAGEQADVREVLSRSPLEGSPGSAITRTVHESIETVTGSAIAEAGVAYWMDAAIFADAGADTVNYGPSGAGAHAAVEWVDLESVVRCARVLAHSAERYGSSNLR